MVPMRALFPLSGLPGCLRRLVRPAVWLLAAELWLLTPAALADAGLSTATGGQRAAARIDLLVKIPEVLSLHLVEESVALDVTRDDIARGFITTAVNMEVRSNARSGFLLQLRTDPTLSRAGEVEGLGAPVPITAAQASIRLTHHGQSQKSQRYALRVKLSLPPDVQPGRYARPVRVSISA